MSNFRIYNLPLPAGPRQPATKTYVDQKNSQDIAINSKASKAEGDEVLFLDGSKGMTGNFQMRKNKIINLSEGINAGDAVNYQQLIDRTVDRNCQLEPSFRFFFLRFWR